MANQDNPAKGAAFERAVQVFLATQGIAVTKNFRLEVGAAGKKKTRRFDLGSESPRIVVECKSNTWTGGGFPPSAKMAAWNEAMFYFSLVPADYQKLLFVMLSRLERNSETLLQYYVRRFDHLIPAGVEIWEYDEDSAVALRMYPLLNATVV